MTIHHAITKSAATKGFVLASTDEQVSAHHIATNTLVAIDTEGFDTENEAAKEAWAIAGDIADFKQDEANAGWKIEQVDGEFCAKLGDAGELLTAESWADLLEAIQAHEPEADDAEEDEDRPTSVVPDHFKKLYKEIGVAGQDNGDWLAAQMHSLCTITDGKKDSVSVEKVELLALANGITYALVEGARGWQGRYRMTVRNILQKKVADTGLLHVPSSLLNGAEPEERQAPAAFCEKWATKPKAKRVRAKKTEASAD